jgi:hypothetical protein
MTTPRDKAQKGVQLIKEAILDFLSQHRDGVPHSEIVQQLNLESDFEGNQKNYLSWSVLGLLVNEGRVYYKMGGRRKLYFPQ